MTTIRELVQETSFLLHDYTGIREQQTYLTAAVDADDLALTVFHANRITLGLIEIDDELMSVSAVDGQSVELFPGGRGEAGSVAATHAMNARVTNDPVFPRSSILSAIKDTLYEVHPTLFQVKTTTITYLPGVYAYGLPADLDRVLAVTYDTPGPHQVWPTMRSWTYIPTANTTDFPTGKAIQVGEAVTPGFKMHLTYAAPYGAVATGAESLAVLGIQESVKEVLKYGSAWRLVQSGELSRLQLTGVASMAQAQVVPPGAVTALAKQLYGIYAQRLAEERRKLLDLYPTPVHWMA